MRYTKVKGLSAIGFDRYRGKIRLSYLASMPLISDLLPGESVRIRIATMPPRYYDNSSFRRTGRSFYYGKEEFKYSRDDFKRRKRVFRSAKKKAIPLSKRRIILS